jgi:site-specific DNA-methyltransferase (adenine-specific)
MSLPKPYYEEDGITIYHGDCREILPNLPTVATVVSDPPYGMDNNTDSSRFSGGSDESVAKRGKAGRFVGKIHGDNEPFDPSPWLSFPQVVLFGCNHYLPSLPAGSLLVWIKRTDSAFGSFLSDAEVAWFSGGRGVYCFRDLSMTALANSRAHPNQKPVGLMEWCVQKTNGPILDPFMGSGTTLVAAKNLGRKAIGIEIEEKYCAIAVDRLRQGVLLMGAE